jgi:hypothetical protein
MGYPIEISGMNVKSQYINFSDSLCLIVCAVRKEFARQDKL